MPTDDPDIADNCDPAPSLTLVDTELPGACPQEKVITRTWTATDACGNSATISQVITIQDTEAPVFSNVPANVTIECDDPLPTDEPTVLDNCDNNVSLVLNEGETMGACPQEKVITRTWTATDACGNSATISQVITIQDTEAPIFSNVPADVTIECDEGLPTDEPSVSDNCDIDLPLSLNDVETPGACPQERVITRTWTVTDDCGNSNSVSQVITIQDSEAPVLANLPADVTIECDDPLPTDAPIATDNCDADVTITVSETVLAGSCPQERSHYPHLDCD
ncbi:MAG: hypothetical protein R2784_14130 [Saprospiraceae bacterium]